jgi:HEAT repeat protein
MKLRLPSRGTGLPFSAAAALATLLLCSAIYFLRAPDPVFQGRLASEWVQDLVSPDYVVRGEAQTALRALGERGVPQISLLLRNRNPFWEKHLIALNPIFPSLNYRAPNVLGQRERGAEMLGLLGPKATAAIPDLIHALELDQSTHDIQHALVRIGPASIEPLAHGLTRNRDVLIRICAARLLREFKPLDEDVIAALIKATRDEHPVAREEAARSLGAAARTNSAAVAALLPLTRDKCDDTRAAAFTALGTIGIINDQVLAAFRAALRDPSDAVQLEAAKGLWNLRQDHQLVVPALIDVVLGYERRWQAAYALAEIGPLAADAVPALVEVLPEERVPRPFRTPPSVVFALGKIGKAALPELALLFAHPKSHVRLSAVLACGIMGSTAREVIPELTELLKDKDAEVRHATALTLASIGAAPEQILAGLKDCLAAEDIYMRSTAAAYLRDFAPDGNWITQPE